MNDEFLVPKYSMIFQKLRNAGPEDINQIFQWRNDPWLISENPGLGKVHWEDHVRWFSEMLDTEAHQLLVIESQNKAGMGMVRLDKAGKDRAIITIHLLETYSGKGFGRAAVREACNTVFEHWPWMKSVHAYIRKDNQRSIKAFLRAGFTTVRRKDDSIFILTEMVLYRST